MKVILLSAVALVVLVASSCGGDESTLTQRPAEKNVKVIIAGTNDALEEVTDGGIAGEGTFRATGAITDKGTVRAHRGVSILNEGLILLRFVTKGEKGTISYLVKIDTTRLAFISRWTIEFATKAYKGLQGKGI